MIFVITTKSSVGTNIQREATLFYVCIDNVIPGEGLCVIFYYGFTRAKSGRTACTKYNNQD